jgi:hypothetical protein
MNVICIKTSKRLVKNATYKVAKLTNFNPSGHRYFRSTIMIKLADNGYHVFPIEYFKPTTGEKFQEIVWTCPDYQNFLTEREETQIKPTIKKGDYVVPRWDSLKTLVQGKKYKISDVQITEHKNAFGNPSWKDIKIKLEGSSRYYASHNFRKCTSQEAREIGLNQLFDENAGTERVGKHKRKFDYYTDDEKKVLLIKNLIQSANDRFRNQNDLIDWTIDKSAKTYGLNREDFKLIENFGFMEVLNLIK